MRLWKYSGIFLALTGALHNFLGTILGWEALLRIAAGGYFSSVEFFNGVFWFLIVGFALILLGHLSHWIIQSTNAPLPSFVGWYLLIVSVIGIFLMPVSGFWLLAPQGLIILSGKR